MPEHTSAIRSGPTDQYTGIAQWLHWLIAGLIIAQYMLAQLAEAAANGEQTTLLLRLLANHKSMGMTILVLAVLRLLWRLGHRPPPAPPTMAAWQHWAATGAHWLIYLLIIALPISGWLTSSAAAYSVSWFGLFQWPDLVAPDPALKENLNNLHHWLAQALFIVVVIHVLATVKHRWLDRDPVFARMFNSTAVATSVVLLVAITWLLGFSLSTAAPPAYADSPLAPSAASEPIHSAAQIEPAGPADLAPPALWQVDYSRSEIRFIAEQAGATFEGLWRNWQAQIQFSAEQLEHSRAVVTVTADSADTGDRDRDATMASTDWFAATDYPTVTFSTNQFARTAPASNAPHALRAEGTLRIKTLAVPVIFYFDVTSTDTERRLRGTARLDRLALGLGLGEWADPESVGQFVTVQVSLVATVP